MKDRGLRFAVCVRNDGYDISLELHKIYRLVPRLEADKDINIRVVDETREDYLYFAEWCVPIEVPEAVQHSLLEAP